MARTMLINVTQEEESRVAIVEDGRLEWIEIETGVRDALRGNIYKGVVENVNSSFQAAFVNFGAERAGFLPFDEVNFRLLPARKRESTSRGKAAGGDRPGRTRIQDHLRAGQEILVQVVREEFGTKPPTLSTFFSLPGRYLVLLPGGRAGGISRKIDTETGRERLRKILKQIEPKDGCALIVRTAGMDQTKVALTRDLRYLTRLWSQIETAAKKADKPSLIFRERDLVLRAIRDLYTPDISEVVIDGGEIYRRAVRYFRSIMPGKQKLVRLYDGDRPLFARYNLEDQIENIYKRRVSLPAGGAIVIDETEALTSIDVNSGKTRESSIEETAHRTNLEAAAEIARQLRLRDIGGLIVIDFIDMRVPSHIRAVEKCLRESMKQDNARYDMTRISKLGLLEMSRQRLRATTMSSSYKACSACDGNGVVKTVESAALSILRKIHTRSAQGDWARIEVSLPPPVADYLQNRKREDLARLEARHRMHIVIHGDPDMPAHESRIDVEHRRAVEEEVRRGRAAISPKVSHADVEDVAAGPDTAATGSRPRRHRARRTREGSASPAVEAPDSVPAATAAGDGEDVPAVDPGPEAPGRRSRRSRGGARGRRRPARTTGNEMAGDAASPEDIESKKQVEPATTPDSPETPRRRVRRGRGRGRGSAARSTQATGTPDDGPAGSAIPDAGSTHDSVSTPDPGSIPDSDPGAASAVQENPAGAPPAEGSPRRRSRAGRSRRSRVRSRGTGDTAAPDETGGGSSDEDSAADRTERPSGSTGPASSAAGRSRRRRRAS
ncbi:MAG: Rne/Rng family ribonuclease [Acidobacteriota bacterium]